MSNVSADALFEALTSDRLLEYPSRPLYYCHGKLHSDWWWYAKAPTPNDIVYRNKEGKYHRIYGPAYVSELYSVEAWYKDGKLHREDGPAYTHKKNKVWFYDGKLHRLDGPAVVVVGHPKEYWIGGQSLSPKNYKKEIERRKRKGLIK